MNHRAQFVAGAGYAMTDPCIIAVELRRLHLPLAAPYRLSYRTFHAFEPIVVRLRDESGRVGFGEGHVSPGSSAETREGAWAFCRAEAERLVGASAAEAKVRLASRAGESPVAATAMHTALEMLEGHPLLDVAEQARLPLLAPVDAAGGDELEREVESRLAQGYRTLKIKVGKDVDADIERVALVRRAARGRARLRVDANRAYARDDARRFAALLDPDAVELFEQPCAAEDWESNAAVARVCAVPLMLDEPICGLADIERAARIEGVGFCKLKLKRFGGLSRLEAALRRVRDLGMEPVLGDGLAAEPCCWMEACVARTTVRNAGEFNGFLKPKTRLFVEPLRVEDAQLVLAPGTSPRLDEAVLERHTREAVRLGDSVPPRTVPGSVPSSVQ